jgi:rhodanese-related sulfurtransferase
MNYPTQLSCILLLSLLLISCSEDNNTRTAEVPSVETTPAQQSAESNPPVEVNTESDSIQQTVKAEPEYVPDYISAADLNKRFEQDSVPFIFDVRSKASYDQSHIKAALSMPYGKTQDSDLARVALLDKNSEIITYCGCPRHLSTLAAEDLTGRGYKNIQVLYEGFWHWKEQQFPTVENVTNTAATTVIRFKGELLENQNVVAGQDLFLQHARSGQLEAVRTDTRGRFELDFHLYGYEVDDQFNLIVANLNNPPAIRLYADPDNPNFVTVNL